LNLEKESSGQKRYGISKLFVIWNSQHLAVELQKQGITNVTVNCSHPGAVATKFGLDSDIGFFVNLIYKTASAVSKIPVLGNFVALEKGAVTNIYLALSDEVKGLTVKFFNNKKQSIESETNEYTSERQQKIYNSCIKICTTFLKY